MLYIIYIMTRYNNSNKAVSPKSKKLIKFFLNQNNFRKNKSIKQFNFTYFLNKNTYETSFFFNHGNHSLSPHVNSKKLFMFWLIPITAFIIMAVVAYLAYKLKFDDLSDDYFEILIVNSSTICDKVKTLLNQLKLL